MGADLFVGKIHHTDVFFWFVKTSLPERAEAVKSYSA